MTHGAFVYNNLKKTAEDDDKPKSRPIVIFCTWGKKSRDDNKPIWTTTPSQDKIEEFFLFKIVKFRAKHYLETFFALLVTRHLVKFMVLIQTTKRCTSENTYPPRIFKNFHNKSYENKPKISKITKT
jgi:hypothetical protein